MVMIHILQLIMIFGQFPYKISPAMYWEMFFFLFSLFSMIYLSFLKIFFK